MRNPVICAIRGLTGGALGGLLGFKGFIWLYKHGFYGLILPGALLGLGCSLLSGKRSMIRGSICGIAALALGFYSDWRFEAFPEDRSFGYFVTHINQCGPVTMLMIGLGGVIGFWLAKDASPFFPEGDEPASRPRPNPDDPE